MIHRNPQLACLPPSPPPCVRELKIDQHLLEKIIEFDTGSPDWLSILTILRVEVTGHRVNYGVMKARRFAAAAEILLKGIRKLALYPVPNSEGLSQIPAWVFKLRNLTELSIAGHMITEIPHQISQLVDLKKLCLEHNIISALSPAIGQLAGLRELSLHGNSALLPNILQPAIGRLWCLEKLTLDGGGEARNAVEKMRLRLRSLGWCRFAHRDGWFGHAEPAVVHTVLLSTTRKADLPRLPTEVWLLIFEKLSGRDFLPPLPSQFIYAQC